MSKELDNIIKEELMKNIVFEKKEESDAQDGKKKDSGKKLQSPKKLGGVTNLGKTCFISEAEVKEKDEWAQAQMKQKYGDEMYGISAQQSGIRANKSGDSESDRLGSGTGTISSAPSGGLISCKCGVFMKVPEKFFEAEQGSDFTKFKDAFQQFDKWVEMKKQDENWMKSHGPSLDELKKIRMNFKPTMSGQDKGNIQTWEKIKSIFNKSPWKEEIGGGEFSKYYKNIESGWNTFAGVSPDGSTNGNGSQSKEQKPKASSSGGGSSGGQGQSNGKPLSGKGGDWDPTLSFKIDVTTSFDENWFKRKFKSGLINAAIMAIKTDAMSRVTADNKAGGYANHKYTADEMLPQDKRKLDGLQWKMTNKVAKDYITYLLGWTRMKERTKDNKVTSQLTFDQGLGQNYAKKALSDRGILARLTQKLFAGGQATNLISCAFQLADPNDGWSVVEEKGKGKDNKGGSSGASGGNGAGGNGGGGAGGGKSSGGGASGGAIKSNTQQITPKQAQAEPQKATLNLLQRVVNLEKEVGINNESTDPFREIKIYESSFTVSANSALKLVIEGDEYESDRYKLVKSVCNGEGEIGTLIDNCIKGYRYT